MLDRHTAHIYITTSIVEVAAELVANAEGCDVLSLVVSALVVNENTLVWTASVSAPQQCEIKHTIWARLEHWNHHALKLFFKLIGLSMVAASVLKFMSEQ